MIFSLREQNRNFIKREPDLDRRHTLQDILDIHSQAVWDIILLDNKKDNISHHNYLSFRLRLFKYALLMLLDKRISFSRYKEFAGFQNGDILYHEDFVWNLDVATWNGETIADSLSKTSTW